MIDEGATVGWDKHRTQEYSECCVIDLDQLDEISRLIGRSIPWVYAWEGSERHNPWLCTRIDIWVSPRELEVVKHKLVTDTNINIFGGIAVVLELVLLMVYGFSWLLMGIFLTIFFVGAILLIIESDRTRLKGNDDVIDA